MVFNQPRRLEERREVAKILVERLKCRLPVAIDGMDDRAATAFAAWPERIYIIGSDGRVAYKGGMGPFDFDVEEANEKLTALLAGAPSRTGG